MASRRNTYTAALFIFGLFLAVFFLILGVVPGPSGFAGVSRPVPAFPAKSKTVWRAAPEQAREWGSRAGRKKPAPRTVSAAIRGHVAPSGINWDWEDTARRVAAWAGGMDSSLNSLLDREHILIELYGGIQRLLGKRLVEDVEAEYTIVRLENGLLAYCDPEGTAQDMTLRAKELSDFARRVTVKYKIPLLYVQAPSKTDVSDLPKGLEAAENAQADQFLTILKKQKVDTLDLRPVFHEAAEQDGAEGLFFRTDHHWTPAGAFLGYQTLCEKLRKWPYRFQIDESLTDPDNFEVYSFENVFLGSQGRRIGSLYAGVDDLEIWSPKFSTDFAYSVPSEGIERNGPFVTSLLFPERLAERGWYDTNPYTIYSGGDYLLTRAVNWKNTSGARALVLRDSFGCGLTPFLSLGFREVSAIDPRNFNGDRNTMLDFIEWLEPDVILVLNSASSLKSDRLFPYLPSAWEAVSEAGKELHTDG